MTQPNASFVLFCEDSSPVTHSQRLCSRYIYNIMRTWPPVSPGGSCGEMGGWGRMKRFARLSVCPPAPPNQPWRRRTSLNSSTRSRGTPGWMRSCSHVCGRTRSRPWSTNTSPAPPTPTEVRLHDAEATAAPCRPVAGTNASACRSFQVSFLLKASWISWWVQRHRWLFWTGWPSGRTWPNPYPTTSSSPPTTRTWQVAALTPAPRFSLINRLQVTDDGFFLFLFSPQPVSSLACPRLRCTDSVCWPGAAAWSWTAGRANPRMKSPSLPMASPWRLRSSSRWLHRDPIKSRSSPRWKHTNDDATNTSSHWSYAVNSILCFNVWLDWKKKKKTLKS